MPLPDMKALGLFLVVPKPGSGFFTFPSAGRGDLLSYVLVICEPIS